MITLQTDFERELWLRILSARASIVYQAPRTVVPIEDCAKSADRAVEELRKR